MTYRVKQLWPLLGVATLLFVGGAILTKCFYVADQEGYRKVLEQADPTLAYDVAKTYQASQKKRQVLKSFRKGGETQNLEAFLSAENAEMVYEQDGEKKVIVENMEHVRCYIQEELYYLSPDGQKVLTVPQGALGYLPKQTVRYVEAEFAKYHYTTETLEASQVSMFQYTASGHSLPRSLDGYEYGKKGKAETAVISMVDGALTFKAQSYEGAVF
jgi:hypothetical protein